MKTVGVYEAKTHLAKLLEEVERGECITITRHGKPIATLQAFEGTRRSPEEAESIVAAFRAFQDSHRGALRGLNVRELIEDGRRY